MITLFATLVLLQQALHVPAALTVREGDRVSSVVVVTTRLGAMIRAQDILSPLGAVLMRDAPDRFRLVVGGSELELTIGMAYARVRGTTQLLGAAPALSQGQLFLPLSLVTDVLPRVVTGFLYDASVVELRRFSTVVPSRRANGDSARVGQSRRSAADSAPPSAADARRNERAAPPPRAERRARRPVVVIDAGHGGPDRGMSGPAGARRKMYEADVTLAVAKQLRDVLSDRGVDLVMTRSTDTLISLADRGRMANRAKGDVFLSIHVNAANPRWRDPAGARGFETYFLSEAKTDDERRVAALENEAVKYEVESEANGGDPLSFILNDMKQNEYLREASALAQTVQRSLGTVHPGTNRGVKQAGFRVLVGAFMPAVLVEVGFGTNAAESVYLSSAAGQRRIAAAIADATMAYLSRYVERRSVGAGGVP
ncbi:MAG: N-acetylmuramoyl-L-alanine amidase [Gemmatimonadaceae bacterium]|nr:N-acetylmuramoyl-L-alanine amidase [Gemmatimonadaceae bacterium]